MVLWLLILRKQKLLDIDRDNTYMQLPTNMPINPFNISLFKYNPCYMPS